MRVRFFETPAGWRAWLEANHATAAEVGVGFRRKATGLPSMTWPEAVDEALCLGWIDGVRHSIDEASYRNRFTPRKPGSTWSKVNIAEVEALEAAGKMTDAGRWYRRAAVHWVTSAKREATRERRLAQLVERSRAGEELPPLRRR